jgi:GT2 family glycosyltransferase
VTVILISRSWFEKIGWNEDYWLYFEDVDLCKVADCGGKVAVTEKQPFSINMAAHLD